MADKNEQTNPNPRTRVGKLESERLDRQKGGAAKLNSQLAEIVKKGFYELYDEQDTILLLKTTDLGSHRSLGGILRTAGYNPMSKIVPDVDGKTYYTRISVKDFLRICKRCELDPASLNIIPQDRLTEIMALPGMPKFDGHPEKDGPSL
jgi:hypothetical protein